MKTKKNIKIIEECTKKSKKITIKGGAFSVKGKKTYTLSQSEKALIKRLKNQKTKEGIITLLNDLKGANNNISFTSGKFGETTNDSRKKNRLDKLTIEGLDNINLNNLNSEQKKALKDYLPQIFFQANSFSSDKQNSTDIQELINILSKGIEPVKSEPSNNVTKVYYRNHVLRVLCNVYDLYH